MDGLDQRLNQVIDDACRANQTTEQQKRQRETSRLRSLASNRCHAEAFRNGPILSCLKRARARLEDKQLDSGWLNSSCTIDSYETTLHLVDDVVIELRARFAEDALKLSATACRDQEELFYSWKPFESQHFDEQSALEWVEGNLVKCLDVALRATGQVPNTGNPVKPAKKAPVLVWQTP